MSSTSGAQIEPRECARLSNCRSDAHIFTEGACTSVEGTSEILWTNEVLYWVFSSLISQFYTLIHWLMMSNLEYFFTTNCPYCSSTNSLFFSYELTLKNFTFAIKAWKNLKPLCVSYYNLVYTVSASKIAPVFKSVPNPKKKFEHFLFHTLFFHVYCISD